VSLSPRWLVNGAMEKERPAVAGRSLAALWGRITIPS